MTKKHKLILIKADRELDTIDYIVWNKLYDKYKAYGYTEEGCKRLRTNAWRRIKYVLDQYDEKYLEEDATLNQRYSEAYHAVKRYYRESKRK